MAMTALEAEKLDELISAAHRFVSACDDFYPEYPEVIVEPLETLVNAVSEFEEASQEQTIGYPIPAIPIYEP